MKKDISNDYQTLTPHERFQLVLKAMARKDEQEVNNLIQNCPRKTYSMLDASYSSRYLALLNIMAAFTNEMELIEGKLTIFNAAQEMLSHLLIDFKNKIELAYFYGLADAGEKSQNNYEKKKELIDDFSKTIDELMTSIKKGIMSRAKADYKVFDETSKQCFGLDLETVIAGIGASKVFDRLDRSELEKAEDIDFEELENVKKEFVSFWEQNTA